MIRKEDIEMIDICLPTFLHKDSSVLALKTGLHVLCEKPAALSVEDALQMLRAARDSKRKLMIGHCLRFSDPYTYLKKCVKDRPWGSLLSVNLYRHSAMPLWSEGGWLLDTKKSGGMPLDLHIHDVDMIVFLLGTPYSVMSYGSGETISTLYEYSDTVVYAEASWRREKDFPFRMGYDAIFEKATVEYANGKVTIYDQVGARTLRPNSVEKSENRLVGNISQEYLSMYQAEISYFIECIEREEEPVVSMPESSITSMKTVFAEIESLLKKTKVILSV
jgi:predicted dehydrogenase